jgi:ABC-type sugar transport system ATPase subunit
MERLKTNALSKSYGGTHALKDISMDIIAGEVHALCGENGAGKSTLIKILSGVERPDTGKVHWRDAPLPLGKVDAIEAHGVVAVHQEPVIFPHLNAVDNLFVGREHATACGIWLNQASMRKQTQNILATLGEALSVTEPVGEMSLAQRQMVSMARALIHQCRILILDEPTASLSARESASLFGRINVLKEQGVGILYVSHRLEEVFKLADRVTVLRDGASVGTWTIKDLNRDTLIEHMVGREVPVAPPTSSPHVKPTTQPVIEVSALCRKGAFNDISFHIQPGEILGMSGLVGAGRSEIARALFGVDRFDSGNILYGGRTWTSLTIQDAIAHGIAMVPEDRQLQGLVLPLSVETNLLLPSLANHECFRGLDQGTMRSTAGDLVTQLGIKTESPSKPAESLSGGNQQKIVIGKWLHTHPTLLILDEPTRGVDVGAKSEVHRIIQALAAKGTAILLISSELPEILSLSDRIMVLCGGCNQGILSRQEATQEILLRRSLPTDSGRDI